MKNVQTKICTPHTQTSNSTPDKYTCVSTPHMYTRKRETTYVHQS